MRKYTKKDKKHFPANTAQQMRIPLFLPVNQVRNRNGELEWVHESTYGKVTTRTHRLTQEHRNIVDVILSYYKPTAIHSDGSWEFCFTLYDLQKALQKKSLTNHSWIKKKFDELQGTQLVIEPTGGAPFKRITCSVLNDHSFRDSGEQGKTGEYLYTVTFNRHYMNIFEQDIHIHSEHLTDAIINIKHASSQALVRYCISHNTVNSSLSKLMTNIGISNELLPAPSISRIKKEILTHSDLLKSEFGIEFVFDNDKYKKDPLVKYKKHAAVWFDNPQKGSN